MTTRAEFRVWEIASRQGSTVTRRQAIAAGMTENQINYRTATQIWRRLKPGVYLLPGHPSTGDGRLAAACAALGAAVSHESAARLHGFSHIPISSPTVTVATRSTNRFPDVVVHQLTDLIPEHVTAVGMLPTTHPPRTLFDLAPVLRRRHFVAVADRALAERIVALPELQAVLVTLGRRGKPGTVVVREYVDERMKAFTATESTLEDLVLRMLRQWNLPEPALQYPLPWRSDRPGRVDFAYPEHRLIIEADGRAWHTTAEAFDTDRMRDNHAQIAGWRVIRITYRMLVDSPDEVRSLIEQALFSTLAG
ncbi:MAG: DUF559 domain-containing protein [Acidimicrobiia bacterium]|nr:DUF559 domain-containing protein [Acidimicrobiia bacterium]